MASSPQATSIKIMDAVSKFGMATDDSLEKVGQLVEDEAKRVIGTYDYGWPRLKPETIARKATGDTPLLETGDLRASITHYVDKAAHAVYVGSDNPKARWHEFGTKTIPARSFLAGAAVAKARASAEIVANDIIAHLSNFLGERPHAGHAEHIVPSTAGGGGAPPPQAPEPAPQAPNPAAPPPAPDEKM